MDRLEFDRAFFSIVQDFPGVYTKNKTRHVWLCSKDLPVKNFQNIIDHFIGKFPTVHNKYPNVSHFQTAAVEQLKEMYLEQEKKDLEMMNQETEEFNDTGKDQVLRQTFGTSSVRKAIDIQIKRNREKK